MSTVKISELSSSANITSDDLFPVVDSTVTKKATAAIIKDFVLGRSGSNDAIHISSSDALKISANTGVNIVGNTSITGSLLSTNGFTGSLSGTATSASFAPTVLPTGTVSSSAQVDYNSIQNKPSIIPTASLAVTASYALNAVSSVFPYTGSAGISGSLLVLGTQTLTGSLLTNADTFILDGTMTVSGSLITTGSVRNTQGGFTGSLSGTATSASYIDFTSISNKPTLVSSSQQINTGSFSGSITSASFATTASYALNAVSSVFPYTGSAGISGSLLLLGNQIISGSLITTADTLDFNGGMRISGSLIATGSIQNTQGGFTGSLSGTATSASFATTASYAQNVVGLSRSTITTAVAGMVADQTSVGSIANFGKSFALFSTTVNTHSRIRLYGSQSFRTNDLARPIGTDPSENAGVIMDLVLSGSPSLFNYTMSPIVNGANVDSTPVSTIYYTVTNLSGTTTDVSMSFNRLVLE